MIDRGWSLRGWGEGQDFGGQPGAALGEAAEGVEHADPVLAGRREVAAQGAELSGAGASMTNRV